MENKRCTLCRNRVEKDCYCDNLSLCACCYSELEALFDCVSFDNVWLSLDSVTNYPKGYSLLIKANREPDECCSFAVYVGLDWTFKEMHFICKDMTFYNDFEWKIEQEIKKELEELILNMRGN
jgi:hypothetical protein